MISKPWRSSSSVIGSGGFAKNVFQRTNVYSPSSRKNFASFFIGSLVPLNGASGSMDWRSFTSSTSPNRPMLRVAPTIACFSRSPFISDVMTVPIRRALSSRWSSSYTCSVASAAAHASGWLL